MIRSLPVAMAAALLLCLACGSNNNSNSKPANTNSGAAATVSTANQAAGSATAASAATRLPTPPPPPTVPACPTAPAALPTSIPGVPTAAADAKVVTTPSGLRYIDLVPGSGPTAEKGQVATVNYTGWLLDGKKFDSSKDRNTPFPFNLGAGQVIKGWDEGVAGMKVGGTRRLIIPPDLAYGQRGFPPAILPCSTLLFDVDLISVK